MVDTHHTDQNEAALGIAGTMANNFIHSPLSPLLFIAMLCLGVLGLLVTPRQEDPQISVPMVDIFIQYPGADAEQVASLAIEPLERIMSEIPGVEHVYSTSQRGHGLVIVRFAVGEAMGPSIVKVHDKIQSNLDKIPPGVAMPLVKPKGIDDVPVVNLTLWSKPKQAGGVDDGVLRALALDVLQQLKSLPNTGQGFVAGGRNEQVKIEILPERLSSYGITLDAVANAVRSANTMQEIGTGVENSQNFAAVVSGNWLRGVDDIKRLVVGTTRSGSPIYIDDIARVMKGAEEPRQMVTYYTGKCYQYQKDHTGSGKPHCEEGRKPAVTADGYAAVTIALAKKEGSNGIDVANAIIAKVNTLKGKLIPDNVNVEVTRNYGETAKDKVNELIMKLFIATGIVTVLVWFALGFRPALVVTMVIPVVILFTVFSAFVLGYTIDRVSLFALIFSIGILVDDAIVVVENMYRRWLLKGEMDTRTAVDAVREVGNPTILATFTVIAALMPMGFVRGMMGPYMEPIPALGSVAMLFSLFAAFVFTPWLAMRIKPSMAYLRSAEKKEHRSNERLEKLFRKVLIPMLESRLLGYGFLLFLIAAFAAACSMFYFGSVKVKMLPFDNKPEFSVVLDMPEGTALPITANLTRQVAEVLRDELPQITAIQTYVGTAKPFDFNGMVRHYYLRQEPWHAEIQVQLTHKTHRDGKALNSHKIALKAREVVKRVIAESGAKATIVEMPPGPPVLQALVAEVYGPDSNTRRQVAADLTQLFAQSPNINDIDNYMREPYNYWHFQVNMEKASRLGISVETINRNLAMALGGYSLGDIKLGNVLEPTNIVIQAPQEVRSQIGMRLKDLPIPTMNQQAVVPISELGMFQMVPQDHLIHHKDLRPVEYVVGDAVGLMPAPIYGMFDVMNLLQTYKAPDGGDLKGEFLGAPWFGAPSSDMQSGFEWTGEWTVTYETFRDMGMAFGVALILIYILVVWEFGNFIVPLVIMSPIPLTLLGIIPGHYLLGYFPGFESADFTATSMIGWIALAGIIVRNSILLVDFAIHEIQAGTPVRDAVVLSCKARTRPIVITAFALVGGSSVIITDPIFQGMAVSLLFGVLISTVLTLVVIPLGCVSVSRSMLKVAGVGSAGLSLDGQNSPRGYTASARATATSSSSNLGGAFMMVFYLLRMPLILLWEGMKGLWAPAPTKKPPKKPNPEATVVVAKNNTTASAATVSPPASPQAAAQRVMFEIYPEESQAPPNQAPPNVMAEAAVSSVVTEPAPAVEEAKVESQAENVGAVQAETVTDIPEVVAATTTVTVVVAEEAQSVAADQPVVAEAEAVEPVAAEPEPVVMSESAASVKPVVPASEPVPVVESSPDSGELSADTSATATPVVVSAAGNASPSAASQYHNKEQHKEHKSGNRHKKSNRRGIQLKPPGEQETD